MRVLVAGATGAIGRQLTPLLRTAGHEVIGVARSAPEQPGYYSVLRADALDGDVVHNPDKLAYLLGQLS